MNNFQKEHDAALARLTGRKAPEPPSLDATEKPIPDMDKLSPTQLALRRIANLGVSLGVARNTLVTQTPMEGPAATNLLNSIPPELRSELKITPGITEDGKVEFVMKSGAYVAACMREFNAEQPKPAASGHSR